MINISRYWTTGICKRARNVSEKTIRVQAKLPAAGIKGWFVECSI